MTERMKEIMLAAATAMDDGRDPFSTEFLREHNVTFHECGDLGKVIATAAAAFAVGDEQLQWDITIAGAAAFAGMEAVDALNIGRRQRAMEKIRGVK